MNNGAYFSLIPSGVMYNTVVSDGSKITYALILGLSNQYGYCFATNHSLAEMRSTSESSIKRHLKELIDENLVTAEYNRRNDRKLTPVVLPTKREKTLKNQKMVDYTQIDDETHEALDNIYRAIK
jgi:DNA-binding MarR family transcriptional regulator